MPSKRRHIGEWEARGQGLGGFWHKTQQALSLVGQGSAAWLLFRHRRFAGEALADVVH